MLPLLVDLLSVNKASEDEEDECGDADNGRAGELTEHSDEMDEEEQEDDVMPPPLEDDDEDDVAVEDGCWY